VSKPIDDFRALPPTDLLRQLLNLKELVKCSDFEPEVKVFADGLLTHLSRLPQRAFEELERMEAMVDSLPQAHQGKDFLKIQLSKYLFVSPNIQKQIEDRIAVAMLQRPPEPSVVKKKVKSVQVSGREFDFPAGMELEA
jgi:hypothetical protein